MEAMVDLSLAKWCSFAAILRGWEMGSEILIFIVQVWKPILGIICGVFNPVMHCNNGDCINAWVESQRSSTPPQASWNSFI